MSNYINLRIESKKKNKSTSDLLLLLLLFPDLNSIILFIKKEIIEIILDFLL
jgi:hypothetical protein